MLSRNYNLSYVFKLKPCFLIWMGERWIYRLKSKSHWNLWEFSLSSKGVKFGMWLKTEVLLNICKWHTLDMSVSIWDARGSLQGGGKEQWFCCRLSLILGTTLVFLEHWALRRKEEKKAIMVSSSRSLLKRTCLCHFGVNLHTLFCHHWAAVPELIRAAAAVHLCCPGTPTEAVPLLFATAWIQLSAWSPGRKTLSVTGCATVWLNFPKKSIFQDVFHWSCFCGRLEHFIQWHESCCLNKTSSFWRF